MDIGRFNSAPIRVLQLATGRWVAHMVGVAAELGLADMVQTGPKTAEQLAEAAGLHAPSLYRLLRALASVGVFTKQEDGRFAQTPMSDALLNDVSYSMRGLARMVNRPCMMVPGRILSIVYAQVFRRSKRHMELVSSTILPSTPWKGKSSPKP